MLEETGGQYIQSRGVDVEVKSLLESPSNERDSCHVS